jgi:hypothetical protein
MTTSTPEAFQPQPDCSYTIWGDYNNHVGKDPAKIVARTSTNDTFNGLRARISKLTGVNTTYKVPHGGRGDTVFYTATDPKAICELTKAVTQEPSRGIRNRISSTLSCPTCRVDEEKNVAMITPSFSTPSTADETGLIPSREIPVSEIAVWHRTYLPWNVVPGPYSRLNIDITPQNEKSTTIYITDVAVPRVYSTLN